MERRVNHFRAVRLIRSGKRAFHVVCQCGKPYGFVLTWRDTIEPLERSQQMLSIVRISIDHPLPRRGHQSRLAHGRSIMRRLW